MIDGLTVLWIVFVIVSFLVMITLPIVLYDWLRDRYL